MIFLTIELVAIGWNSTDCVSFSRQSPLLLLCKGVCTRLKSLCLKPSGGKRIPISRGNQNPKTKWSKHGNGPKYLAESRRVDPCFGPFPCLGVSMFELPDWWWEKKVRTQTLFSSASALMKISIRFKHFQRGQHDHQQPVSELFICVVRLLANSKW